MGTGQKFGGPWTVEKLNILSDYLNFYTTALKNQPFQLIYIDAFAGTGKINIGNEDEYEVIDGSARLALQASGQFAEYIFIEKKKSFAKELEEMVRQEFSQQASRVKILNEDCNQALINICQKVNWKNNRAVLFLDPYAADVRWETLSAVAATEAIDVWYLFPFSAANRLMKKTGEIDPTWREKLDSIFGDSSWEAQFYEESPQMDLFNEVPKERVVSTESLKKYIEARLNTIFPKVSPNSRILSNRKNSPLFLFCFAVASKRPKAIGLAMNVADYILRDKNPSLGRK